MARARLIHKIKMNRKKTECGIIIDDYIETSYAYSTVTCQRCLDLKPEPKIKVEVKIDHEKAKTYRKRRKDLNYEMEKLIELWEAKQEQDGLLNSEWASRRQPRRHN